CSPSPIMRTNKTAAPSEHMRRRGRLSLDYAACKWREPITNREGGQREGAQKKLLQGETECTICRTSFSEGTHGQKTGQRSEKSKTSGREGRQQTGFRQEGSCRRQRGCSLDVGNGFGASFPDPSHSMELRGGHRHHRRRVHWAAR